jgi:hypothetical protein
MNTKSEIINYLNNSHGTRLDSTNTSFSNINVAKKVWWTNIPLHKFNNTHHLLFNNTNEVIWIVLPKNFVTSLSTKFRIRQDRDSVDIEVWAEKDERYMTDVKSGGTGFDFKPFIKEIIAK